MPEETKIWMNEHVPFAQELHKQQWINIAISVISKTLVDRAAACYYFGSSSTLPISAASELAFRLKRKTSVPSDLSSLMFIQLKRLSRRTRGWRLQES